MTAARRLPLSSTSSTASRCCRTAAWCSRTRATSGSGGCRRTARSRPSPARGRSASLATADLRPSAQIAAPRGIATLPDGSILFPDSGNHRVRRISPAGVITTVAGTGRPGFSGDGGPRLAAQLNFPFAVSPLAGGGFLIADAGNSRIRRVAADGTITTVATQLSSPHAVAALPDGGFLVADTNNNRVTRSAPDGTATTVAGTGAAGFSGDGGPAATARSTSRRHSPCYLTSPASSSATLRTTVCGSSGSTSGRRSCCAIVEAASDDGRSPGDAPLHAVRASGDPPRGECAAGRSSCVSNSRVRRARTPSPSAGL